MNRKSVLIIDDDEAIRETVGDILESHGYRTTLAADGAEGIQSLRSRKHPPSLIILDMMMPGTNGWEFLDQQRSDPQLAKIPVIVCSAYTESGKSVHPDAFLSKPVRLRSLLNTVEELCA